VLNRHVSTKEWFISSLMSLCGSAATTCLINDAVPKATVMVDLLSNLLDSNFGHQVDATDSFSLLEHLARVSDHLLRGPESSRYLGISCRCRSLGVMRWISCIRRRALRFRLVNPGTP
jgi:hypothetical protein